MSKQNVILHLSDLHFGWGGREAEEADRRLALNGLLESIERLEDSWKPTLLCVSGDIGWRGKEGDYESAARWFEELFKRTGIARDSVIVCPGNHDVNREVSQRYARPTAPTGADNILAVPIPDYLKQAFTAYEKFCRDVGIVPVSVGKYDSYLVGQRETGGISFVVCNSAWFCQDDEDHGRLWIGLPLLKSLEANEQLPQPSRLRSHKPTIALIHHPREWLAEAELRASEMPNRPNTFDYLVKRCHLLLSGHTHGEVRAADQLAGGAFHLSGGASYAGAAQFNSYRLVRVDADSFVYQSFEFDPRSAENKWSQKEDARRLLLQRRTD